MRKYLRAALFALVPIGGIFYLSSFTEHRQPERIANPDLQMAENVVIFIIDGPRFSETFGDTAHRYIPHLANDLAPQGALIDNFRNNGHTYTIAGHTAICTGRYKRMANDGSQLPAYPSIFQQFLCQKQLPSDQAWIITSKGKLNVLGQTKDREWKDKCLPNTYCGPNGNNMGYGYDSETFVKAKEILAKDHPKLVLINMLDVDVWAHANNWDRYLKALRDTDSLAWEMWKFIQSDPVYKDKTDFIITNDHGRHLNGVKNGFVSHGGGCEGCRHMYLLALGPDFKQGYLCKKRYEQIDISATVGHILNFNVPDSKGRFMSDIFRN